MIRSSRTLLIVFAVCLLTAQSSRLSAEPENFVPGQDELSPDGIYILDGSYVLDVGELRVNITNHGLIGSQYSGGYTYSHAPSGEWPGGSGNEYLWGAGLWIGAMQGGHVSVTTGQTERELRPDNRVRDTIYEALNGYVQRPQLLDVPTGRRMPDPHSDDDGDGHYDEEILNGIDDDQDGKVDEDFAQLGNQMFTCTMFDNLPLIEAIYPEHQPLGVRVVQTAFAWDQGDYENLVGLDFDITNVGNHQLEDVYLGFYVDCDIQARNAGANRPNDLVGIYSGAVRAEDGFFYRVDMGYMWDGAEEDPLPGYFGTLLADHKTAFDGVTAPFYPSINSFQVFSTQASTNQEGEPQNDNDRYYLMSRDHHDRTTRPDEKGDYKFLMSSGPFNPLEIGDSMKYSVAFVIGNGLEELLQRAGEAKRLFHGRWYDMDNDPYTGRSGRETLVCLGDYPTPQWGDDPILGHRLNFMDDSCTGGYPVMFQDVVHEDNLMPYPDDQLCVWVNMDNCTECFRSWGRECNDQMFFSTRYRFRTGVGGRETNYPWSLHFETPPISPRVRVVPGDGHVELFWDDRSEFSTDPARGVSDFESYRIWRVTDWVPPGDQADLTSPPVDEWGMVGEFDLVNQIPAGIAGSQRPVPLGRNTGLEPIVYRPVCLDDPRFEEIAASMQTLIDSDPDGIWISRPPVRRPDGHVASYMIPFQEWETYPDVLDTFWTVTPRAPSAGIVEKHATRYYHYIDRELHNGFKYYYAVVARDHQLSWQDGQYVPSGAGVEEDPSNHFQLVLPGPLGQTVADRKAEGNNIYVYPNPATREALAEFQPRELSLENPTGVRIMFNNLPRAHNTIRIFTVAGDLLQTLEHDGYESGSTSWNLMTRNGQEVVSGLYLYSVHSDVDDFDEFRGKFVVIR